MKNKSLEKKIVTALMGINLLNTMTPMASLLLHNPLPHCANISGGDGKGTPLPGGAPRPGGPHCGRTGPHYVWAGFGGGDDYY